MESLNKVSAATKYLHYAVYYQVLRIEAMDLFLKKIHSLGGKKKKNKQMDSFCDVAAGHAWDG